MSNKLDVYLYWGVEFSHQVNGEMIGSCPFCEQNGSSRPNLKRFYVNQENGCFSCKPCGREGNQKDFLAFIFQKFLEKTTEQELRKFMILTGIPLPGFRGKIACCGKDKFIAPAYNERKEVVDIRVFRPGKKEHSTKSNPDTGLVGADELINSAEQTPVFIVEGFRDKLALDWLFWRNRHKAVVVATPSANVFKKTWITLFSNRDVTICYDHDISGYGTIDPVSGKTTGSQKVAAALKPYVKSIKYVTWPPTTRKGYDVRDFVIENKVSPEAALDKFNSYIHVEHCSELLNKVHSGNANNISLTDILTDCGRVYELTPDLINAIKLSFAVYVANFIPGKDKPWLFLVGPPACGKTLPLELIKQSSKVIYESRLTRTALVSGWNLGTNQVDTSIMARVNGKMLVLKDATELFALNTKELEEVFALLRGAFDGSCSYAFGNGTRRYNALFTCIMGVTNSVQAYNMSSLGERFLRYKYRAAPDEDLIMDIASKARLFGNDFQQELSAKCCSFLENVYDFSPEKLFDRQPEWFRNKLKVLAKLLAWLRTAVTRVERGYQMGNVAYEPQKEAPYRVHNQLESLALCLSLIEDKPAIDEQIYSLCKRIGKDSIPEYTYKIVKVLANLEKPLTLKDISTLTKIRNLNSVIEDLTILEIVESHHGKYFSINKEVKKLWQAI